MDRKQRHGKCVGWDISVRVQSTRPPGEETLRPLSEIEAEVELLSAEEGMAPRQACTFRETSCSRASGEGWIWHGNWYRGFRDAVSVPHEHEPGSIRRKEAPIRAGTNGTQAHPILVLVRCEEVWTRIETKIARFNAMATKREKLALSRFECDSE